MRFRLLFPSILTFHPRAINAHYFHGGWSQKGSKETGAGQAIGVLDGRKEEGRKRIRIAKHHFIGRTPLLEIIGRTPLSNARAV